MRRLTLFVSAILMALFASITLYTISVEAQEAPSMATWSGENLQYKEEDWSSPITLTRSAAPENDANIPNLDGTDCQDNPHIYYSSPGSLAGQDTARIYVICLGSPFDGSDKTEPIPAMFIQFSAPPGTTDASEFGNPGRATVTIAPEGTDGEGNPIDTTTTESTSTCDGEGTKGIGWLVCPVTRWLASGMDALFGILESFLIVAPLSTNTDSPLFIMWRIMQNFANILFIIGFLIIIYSQITSYGLSNYGLKRLLPRLIIAAILVNVSYWIAAAAVDLSNILGASLYDLLTGIGETVQENSTSDVPFENITWSNIAGVVLSAGAAGAAIFGAAAGVMATAGGSLWLLLVVLAGVMVSALVAILVLAARQALITILIVISPLAFVAYLLPSTEKYFDRWRSLFTTMLLLYPMISIVFGGAQLAGLVIIYGALDGLERNPNDPNFFNIIILGMIVQVAPVVITPLLVRLGGSLLGRIAGIVNDPNKGIIDRTRKFAENRRDMTRNRQMFDRDPNTGKLRNSNPLAASARWNALREENNANKLKAWQGGLHAEYEKTHGAREVLRQNRFNEMVKSAAEDEGKAELERAIGRTSDLREMYYRQRVNRDEAEAESKRVGTLYEGIQADPAVLAKGAIERQLADRAKAADRLERSLESRESMAKRKQEEAYNEAIRDNTNTELREFAGFNEIDPHGVARVVNIAQEAGAKNYATLVDNANRALEREEATLEEALDLIKTGTSSNPAFAHFGGDIESRSAAVRYYMDHAPMRLRHELQAWADMSKTALRGTDDGILRSEIAGALKKNKPFHVSQTFLNDMLEGNLDPIFNNIEGRNRMIADTLNKFAFDADAMVSIDQDDIGAIADFLQSPQQALLTNDARDQIKKALDEAFTIERYKGRMGKRRGNLNKVRDQLNMSQIWE